MWTPPIRQTRVGRTIIIIVSRVSFSQQNKKVILTPFPVQQGLILTSSRLYCTSTKSRPSRSRRWEGLVFSKQESDFDPLSNRLILTSISYPTKQRSLKTMRGSSVDVEMKWTLRFDDSNRESNIPISNNHLGRAVFLVGVLYPYSWSSSRSRCDRVAAIKNHLCFDHLIVFSALD